MILNILDISSLVMVLSFWLTAGRIFLIFYKSNRAYCPLFGWSYKQNFVLEKILELLFLMAAVYQSIAFVHPQILSAVKIK